jgi:hypothetical protein
VEVVPLGRGFARALIDGARVTSRGGAEPLPSISCSWMGKSYKGSEIDMRW